MNVKYLYLITLLRYLVPAFVTWPCGRYLFTGIFRRIGSVAKDILKETVKLGVDIAEGVISIIHHAKPSSAGASSGQSGNRRLPQQSTPTQGRPVVLAAVSSASGAPAPLVATILALAALVLRLGIQR